MDYFRGYVLTKGKKCIDKFKNVDNLKTLSDVCDAESYAGVLDNNVVLIDIDDTQQSEMLYKMIKDLNVKCRVYQTSRGKHFLFKNNNKVKSCGTGVHLACGLTADIKVGSKNSYSILKIHNVEREIIEDVNEADEIPYWLYPVKSGKDLVSIKEHDGRNSALFGYILTLQRHRLTVKQARETIHIINKYVFAEPLSDDELNVILRDEAFDGIQFYDEDNKFLFDEFAQFLINTEHIIRLNGQLHCYQDGIYVTGLNVIERLMVKHIPKLNRSRRQEVSAYIDLLTIDEVTVSSPHYIAFKNGIYNVLTDEFTGFTPDIIITNKIDWNYNPDAHSDVLDEMLNNISCNDLSIRAILEEIAGSTLYRANNLAGGKAVILTGEGANGKSTYLKVIRDMIGEKNTSSLDLRKLDERFNTVTMYNKLANIGDDISDEFIIDTSTFKKIVTGETINAEQKGQPVFNFKPYCKLLFSSNSIPRLGRGNDAKAILRRLVIVPFNANFKSTDVDFNPNIEEELADVESMEYMIQLSLKGLKRLLENKNYSDGDRTEAELKNYQLMNDPIFAFLEYCKDEEVPVAGERTSKVYENYTRFCTMENLKPCSLSMLSRRLRSKGFDVKAVRINKKVVKIYVKSEEN